MPEPKEIIRRSAIEVEKMNLVSSDCAPKSVSTLHLLFQCIGSSTHAKVCRPFSLRYRLAMQKTYLERFQERKMLYSKWP
jgi:hypothetical protein